MKQVLFVVFCAVLMCGCSKSNTDSAKIEALSQKLDLVMKNQSITVSNQFAIWREVEAVKSQVTNEMVLISGTFADTGNLITQGGLDTQAIESHIDATIASHSSIQFASISGFIEGQTDLILTNLSVAYKLNDSTISQPEAATDSIEWMQMQDDIFDMNTKVDDMQEDLIKIKTRLGIIY